MTVTVKIPDRYCTGANATRDFSEPNGIHHGVRITLQECEPGTERQDRIPGARAFRCAQIGETRLVHWRRLEEGFGPSEGHAPVRHAIRLHVCQRGREESLSLRWHLWQALPQQLQMIARANCVTRIQERLRKAQLGWYVGGRDVDHPAQVLAASSAIEFGERIERFQVIRGRVTRRLQNPAGILGMARQSEQGRLKQPHVGIVRSEVDRAIDLPRGVLIPTHPEIDETEVRVPGGLIRCQLDQLLEFSLGVLEPVVLQVREAECAGSENGAGVGRILLATLVATECECRERCDGRDRDEGRAVHGTGKLTPHCGAGYCLRHVLATFHRDSGVRRRDRCRPRVEWSRGRQYRGASRHPAE